MLENILVHLVIVGRHNLNGDVFTAVKDARSLRKICHKHIDEDAYELCMKHINAPPNWYELKRGQFFQHDNVLNLVYSVALPNDTKLKNCEWILLSDLHTIVKDELTLLSISRGL